MTREEIIERLKNIVKPFVNNQEAFDNLTEDTDFITDLQINSANLVDIVLDVEDAFEISIDNLAMEKMISIKATIEIIETKLAEK
ncbi:acyl carrier protein [Flavobacterium sp. J49]|uniref:acyl carrier protein n=1 Tax=Flavobacterium sp. J49 TaxID=2718534 RepID=UPI001593DB87|nr:acyl carrier protein [Flavobacterium sp. J49]MBF6642089.1 acyl carrier protein [Flavobacterium sp. J49]NIC03336.1 acyl carrier protein [Flavobacterium sp. J49]